MSKDFEVRIRKTIKKLINQVKVKKQTMEWGN